jgi:hypothetical protein
MVRMRRFSSRLTVTLIGVAVCSTSMGCYKRVISSTGIGSDRGSQKIYEPNRKEDPIDRLLYGESDKKSGSYRK